MPLYEVKCAFDGPQYVIAHTKEGAFNEYRDTAYGDIKIIAPKIRLSKFSIKAMEKKEED